MLVMALEWDPDSTVTEQEYRDLPMEIRAPHLIPDGVVIDDLPGLFGVAVEVKFSIYSAREEKYTLFVSPL